MVTESVTKIMACGATLMEYTQWCSSSPDCCHTKNTVSAESGSRLSVAAYCVHASLPVLVPGVPQPVVAGRDEPYCSRRAFIFSDFSTESVSLSYACKRLKSCRVMSADATSGPAGLDNIQMDCTKKNKLARNTLNSKNKLSFFKKNLICIFMKKVIV